MATYIDDTIYEHVVDILREAENNPELVADVWQALADAGDVYAANAYDIIAQRDNPQSIFAKIVQAHWDRVVGQELREANFLSVGLQHVQQYVALIGDGAFGEGDDVRYRLPDTERIEASYRQAVIDHGLPALTAVDSMFSVLDYNIETSSDAHYETMRATGVVDISWARILDPELEPERIKYDSEVFLEDDIEPVKEVLLTALTLPPDDPTRGALMRLVLDAAGDVLPQLLGSEDPQALALTAGLLAASEPTMSDAKMFRLLDAAFLGEEVSAVTQRRDLSWLTRELYRAMQGGELDVTGSQDELYSAAASLIESLREGDGFQFIELAGVGDTELLAKAKQSNSEGQAYRFALVNSHPFVLLSSGGQATPGAQDPGYGLENFTEEYLSDRAEYIETLTQFYSEDAHVHGDETVEYHDLASGTPVTKFSTGGVSRRVVFGGDVLDQGGSEEDHLYGGRGDDLLEGKGGADYLEGGEGFDTYRAGDGDTLLDTDGQGRVLFRGRVLKGGSLQPDGSYLSDDGAVSYRLENGVLTVATPEGSLTVKDYESGELGIALSDAEQEPGEQTNTLVGDLKWKDHNDSEPGIQTRTDELDNIIYDSPAEEEPDQADTLYDSTSNDHIQSGGGEDVIYAFRGGDDHIEAGEGQDIADGGAGTDLIEGGAGTDLLAGGGANDQLYAEEEIGLADFLDSDTGATTNTRDWLAGGSGDDWMEGRQGDDLALGGTFCLSHCWQSRSPNKSTHSSAKAGLGSLL